VSSARATFFHYVGQSTVRLVIGLVLIAVAAFVAVIPPRIIGAIVDDLNRGAELGAIVQLALLMIALAAAENVVRGFGRFNIIDSSRRLEYRMRNDLFAQLEGCTSRTSSSSASATSWRA